MIPSTHSETVRELGLQPPMPGLDSFGNYNTAPEPMTTITAEEYSHRLLHWQVLAIESRQPKVLSYNTLRIHWLNTGNGVGMSQVWRSLPGGGHYIPRYWLIGCPHTNMTSTETSNCLSTQVCQDCGYRTVVDSSG